jgi:adenine-specific DNA-methyltransferase
MVAPITSVDSELAAVHGVRSQGDDVGAEGSPAGLVKVSELSYGAAGTGNLLIHGENLDVLKKLRRTHSESVRCVYLDPPYNNSERYRHYDDRRSHAAWESMMIERLDALLPLLREDGSVWISIDDREVHYLKVAADGVFGRNNFVTTVIWQQRTTRENRRAFSNNHEYILVYARDANGFRRARNKLPPDKQVLARYRNPDADPRGPWQSVSLNVQDGHATQAQRYVVIGPGGRKHVPPEGRCWMFPKRRMDAEMAAGNIWFGSTGEGVPRMKLFLSEHNPGLNPESLWLAAEVGTTDEAKKQLIQMFPEEPVFDTPKPERLISRILQIATNEGDLVLDPFLGSGTTSAVATMLSRRHIGIEQGDHARTLCAPRLRDAVNAAGGAGSQNGFDFYVSS